MVETRAEDQLRRMAPSLFGGGRAFFTLWAAFPGTKNCDAGIDSGGDLVLAKVVSGTVKVQTQELADTASFVQDTERIVLGNARQLYADRSQPAASAPAGKISGHGPAVQGLPGRGDQRPVPGQPADHPLHQREAHRRRAPAGRHRAAAHRH